MAELLEDEHLTEIKDLLSANWNAANTSLADDPHVHTGWWDWGRDAPTVTVTNPNVNPVGGGATGLTHLTGDGRAGQEMSGFCLVNGWGGTYDTPAIDDNDLSPKVVAWEFCKEIRRILLENASGTLADDGTPALLSAAPGPHRRIVETFEEQEHPTLFRYEVEATFTYVESA